MSLSMLSCHSGADTGSDVALLQIPVASEITSEFRDEADDTSFKVRIFHAAQFQALRDKPSWVRHGAQIFRVALAGRILEDVGGQVICDVYEDARR